MVAADALAILVGYHLKSRLPEKAIRIGAAVAFAVFGILLIAEAISG
jgi:putative Ca2+/H+ antiporter (TMEM165/GDT1 family)